MSYLESLFTQYGTDKGIWGYTPYYEEAMGKQRLRVKKVLEIGICGYRDIPNNVVGASLFVWRDFFPNAEIYGIDNDPRFIFNDQDRITTRCCDAYNPTDLGAVMKDFGGGFDMIVDDAVHEPVHQVVLMQMLSKSMVRGARYFIEEACPYKVDGPIEQWFVDRLPTKGCIASLHACVTHKPEELLIGIK